MAAPLTVGRERRMRSRATPSARAVADSVAADGRSSFRAAEYLRLASY